MARTWGRPAILGGFDGLGCLLGAALPALSNPHNVFREAFGIGIAEMVFMAGSEWLSESRNGLGASLVVGGATGTAAIVPAVPFLLLPSPAARIIALLVLLAFATVISRIRSSERGRRAYVECAAILAIGAAAVWAGELLISGGGL